MKQMATRQNVPKPLLRNTRVLTTAAFLTALAVILGFFKIPVTNLIEIRFQNVPVAIGGMLFGPMIGGLIGGLTDILSYLVKPTGPFFPGFTVSSVITGLIYGLMLRKNPSILRIFLAQVLYIGIVGIFLNTYWLSVVYGMPFRASLIPRLPKELIMIPINTAIFAVILKPIYRLVTREGWL